MTNQKYLTKFMTYLSQQIGHNNYKTNLEDAQRFTPKNPEPILRKIQEHTDKQHFYSSGFFTYMD